MVSIKKTPVAILQELATKIKAAPIYEIIYSEEGGHENVFHYEVTVLDRSAVGIHSTKKGAKHNAAEELLKLFPADEIFNNKIDEAKTPISLLQEWAVKYTDSLPEYKLIFSKEGGYKNFYKYQVTLLNEKGISGARNKKRAQHRAADNLLQKLINKNCSSNNNEAPRVPDFDSRVKLLHRKMTKSNPSRNKEYLSESLVKDENFYEDSEEEEEIIFAEQGCATNDIYLEQEPNYWKVNKSLKENKTSFADNNIYQGYSDKKIQTHNRYIPTTLINDETLKTSVLENKNSHDFKRERIPIKMQQTCVLQNNICSDQKATCSTTGTHKKNFYQDNKTKAPISMQQKSILRSNIIVPTVENDSTKSSQSSEDNEFIKFKLKTIDCKKFTTECVLSSICVHGTAESKHLADQVAAVKMLESLMDRIAELKNSKLELTENDKELCMKRFSAILNGKT